MCTNDSGKKFWIEYASSSSGVPIDMNVADYLRFRFDEATQAREEIESQADYDKGTHGFIVGRQTAFDIALQKYEQDYVKQPQYKVGQIVYGVNGINETNSDIRTFKIIAIYISINKKNEQTIKYGVRPGQGFPRVKRVNECDIAANPCKAIKIQS